MRSSNFAGSFLLCCSVLFAAHVHSQAPSQWISVSSGSQIPSNALVGGNETDGTPLYVAIVSYNNQWHGGKTRKDWSHGALAFGDREINSGVYKVLVADRNYFWQYAPRNTFYPNAVTVPDRQGMYLCRCQYQGGTQIGATWQGALGCAIGFGGTGIFVESYSLLFQPAPPPPPPPPVDPFAVVGKPFLWRDISSGYQVPANALTGGKESDGKILYVAIAFHNNEWIPGKTRKDWNFASIGANGEEVNARSYKILMNNKVYFWETPRPGKLAPNAVPADSTRARFICSCELNGGIQVGSFVEGSNTCSFGYGGAVFTSSKYKILYYNGAAEK